MKAIALIALAACVLAGAISAQAANRAAPFDANKVFEQATQASSD